MGYLNTELIKSQKKLSTKTGLIQICEYNLDPASIILHRVRHLIDGNLI